MNPEVFIRPALARDNAALVGLMAELGYHWTPSQLAEHVPRLREKGHEVWVACQVTAGSEERVVGCISAILDMRLAEGCVGEIVSLVVLDECRGSGAGYALLQAAQAWLEPQVGSIRIRANTRREEAHGFYLRAGYLPHKSQQVFIKQCAAQHRED
ncbi:GNAT family N-acetyltransferase [Aliamphritea spongicola]|uniref:GNAT family N-acetyltransferase n=1 Tax=Aliamphritea spongicola TaxID=707589 RepID=UPI00196B9C22|nr:GNAT family N-acetyltransferase [Aliamphritea spongicola]MBN3564224.1 GNAT family N-acetyltransferase [Aliamphritea spongicola]